MPLSQAEWIRIRIDQYEAEIPVSSLPEWPILKFRKLLKLIRDPGNAFPDEWERLEGRLKEGLAVAGAVHRFAEECCAKRHFSVDKKSRSAAAVWARKHNRSLEDQVKQASRQVKAWEALLKIYDKERNLYK